MQANVGSDGVTMAKVKLKSRLPKGSLGAMSYDPAIAFWVKCLIIDITG